jgi:hypothetical protein
VSPPDPSFPIAPGPPREVGPPRSARAELAESTAHGEVYLRRLRARQLTLSLLALVAFGGVFGSLPLVLLEIPAIGRAELVGIPVSVLLLVIPLWPLLLAIAWLYRRRADAVDEAFRELLRDE